MSMVIGITEAFKADSFGEKINLGVGAYRMLSHFLDHVSPDTAVQVMTRGNPTSYLPLRQQNRKLLIRIWIRNMPVLLVYHRSSRLLLFLPMAPAPG